MAAPTTTFTVSSIVAKFNSGAQTKDYDKRARYIARQLSIDLSKSTKSK